MKRKFKNIVYIEPIEYLIQIRDYQTARGEPHKAKVTDIKISRQERKELKKRGIRLKRKFFTDDWLMEW